MKTLRFCSTILIVFLFSASVIFGEGRTEKKAEKVTITWRQGSWWKDVQPGIIEKFEAENPGIKVIPEVIPWPPYLEKALASALSPATPDVLALSGVHMPSLAEKGLLIDLASFIEKSDKMNRDQFFDAAWKLGDIQGVQYAIPYRAEGMAFYYNTNLFKEVGIDASSPPETHQDLLEYARKLTTPGKRFGFGIPAASKNLVHFIIDLAYPIWANGGNFLNDEWTKAILSESKTLRGVKFWTELFTKYKVVPEGCINYDSGDIGRLFGAETVAMYYAGSWGIKNIQETATPTLDYKISSVPPGKATFLSSWVLTVPKNSKEKEAAWKFIEWFTLPENLPGMTIRTPAVKAAIDHPEWSKPEKKPFLENAIYGRALPQISQWPEIMKVINDEVQAILLGEKSVDDAMEQASAKIDDLLK